MYHFFVSPEQIGESHICITGSDVNHIKNVLRMKPGEQVLISNGMDKDYHCEIDEVSPEEVTARILSVNEEGTELPAKLYLFQGLPKSDKMELIVQKAVELGVKEIIPVATKRAVVKLDEKKAQKKQERWQAIAESAAKQSRRGIIPKGCKEGRGESEALEFHCGERGQAVQTAHHPGGDGGDEPFRGVCICKESGCESDSL